MPTPRLISFVIDSLRITCTQKQQPKNNNNITIAFIDSWWWSLNAILLLLLSLEPAFQLLTPLLTLPAFLSLSLRLLFLLLALPLLALCVSVSEVEVSFCFFCCFCFCFVADHESPNSHSRRLLFDLNGLWVSVVLCDDREKLCLTNRVIPHFKCALCVVYLLMKVLSTLLTV